MFTRCLLQLEYRGHCSSSPCPSTRLLSKRPEARCKMAESLSTDDRTRRRREIEGKRAKVEELRRARAAREAERRANAVCNYPLTLSYSPIAHAFERIRKGLRLQLLVERKLMHSLTPC